MGASEDTAGLAGGGVGAAHDGEAATDGKPASAPVNGRRLSSGRQLGAPVFAGSAPAAPGGLHSADSPPRGGSTGRFLRGGGRVGRRVAQGLGAFSASDVFRAGIRLVVRALRSARLSGRSRAGLRLP